MAAITINDLPLNIALDRKAMTSIRGAGAPWVFGWIRPFSPAAQSDGPVINFFQINNFADQMINQFQLVNVQNSAPNANINVSLDERSANSKTDRLL